MIGDNQGLFDLDLPIEIEPERYELLTPYDPFPFEPTRREFLRVLGGGLVVLCLLGLALYHATDRLTRRLVPWQLPQGD